MVGNPDTGSELKTPGAARVSQPFLQRGYAGSFMRAGNSSFPPVLLQSQPDHWALKRLRFTPLVPGTLIRITHPFNMDRCVWSNLSRSINCFRLRVPNVAGSVRAGAPDSIVTL